MTKTIDEIMLLADEFADCSRGDGIDERIKDSDDTVKARAAVVAALREALTERKPLTHEQIVISTIDIDTSWSGYFIAIARAVEAAHGIGVTP